MGKLIDAEDFSKVIKDYFTDMITHHKYNVDCVDCNADLQHLLYEQPTAYDIDKVVEEIEANGRNTDVCISKIKVIEIVKQGGVGADDVCEWKHFSNDKSPYRPSCSQYMKSKFEAFKIGDYCTFCGKKIKVVE